MDVCLGLPYSKTHITYLGIKIGELPCSLYHLNFPPVISKIINELETWAELPLTLFGRCHLYKMISFPKLLYPLQTIFLLLKHKDLVSHLLYDRQKSHPQTLGICV